MAPRTISHRVLRIIYVTSSNLFRPSATSAGEELLFRALFPLAARGQTRSDSASAGRRSPEASGDEPAVEEVEGELDEEGERGGGDGAGEHDRGVVQVQAGHDAFAEA